VQRKINVFQSVPADTSYQPQNNRGTKKKFTQAVGREKSIAAGRDHSPDSYSKPVVTDEYNHLIRKVLEDD
jgi:hypothetical protein